MKAEIKNMYLVLLNTDRQEYMKLKIQVLRNLFYFLNAEEVRALKKNEKCIFFFNIYKIFIYITRCLIKKYKFENRS